MLLVASFSFCDREQNVAFLTRAASRQMPIRRRFGAFIGQVAAPAAQLLRRYSPWKVVDISTFGQHYSGMFLCWPRRAGASASAWVSLLRVCAGSIFSSTAPISMALSTPPVIFSCSAAS